MFYFGKNFILVCLILVMLALSFFFLKQPIFSFFNHEQVLSANKESYSEKMENKDERENEAAQQNIKADTTENFSDEPKSEQIAIDANEQVENQQNQNSVPELISSPFCQDHRMEEPSGVAYHPQKQVFFVVGDQGEIYRVDQNGQLRRREKIDLPKNEKQGDFEGIAVDPATELLYVAREGDDEILEINPNSYEVIRKFNINRYFQGKLVLHEDGDGIEGLAFNPEKRTFYLTNQQFDLDNENDASAVLEVALPLEKGSQKLDIINYKKMPYKDLSEIAYDSQKSTVYLISDQDNKLILLDKELNVQSETSVPGNEQEGLSVLSEGGFIIAQDTGGLIKVLDKNKIL